MVVGRKVHSGLWWGSRKHVLDLEIDGRVIELRISKEWDWRAFRVETSGGCCEHGNELLELINCGEIFDDLSCSELLQ